jgi:hypothetical protein
MDWYLRVKGTVPASFAGIFEHSTGARNREGIELLYRPATAGILKQSMGAGSRVEIGLWYRPDRLRSLADWFLGIDSWAL